VYSLYTAVYHWRINRNTVVEFLVTLDKL
jgi:hypothetical protein